jgi:chromosome partitioning protein
MSKCTVISIANQKGGVSKTTSALNIAAGLGIKGHKVLLVDLNPSQQSLTYSAIGDFISEDRGGIVYGLENRIKTPDVEELIYSTEFENVCILPAEKLRGYDVELAISQHKDKYEKLKKLLLQDFVQDNFEYVIVDTAPKLGTLLINALNISDFVIVAMKAGALERKGVADLLATFEEIKEEFNPKLEIAAFLIAMESARSVDARAVKKEIQQGMPDVFVSNIRSNVLFTRLAEKQLSIFDVDKTKLKGGKFKYGNGYTDYMNFIDGLLKVVESKKELNNHIPTTQLPHEIRA